MARRLALGLAMWSRRVKDLGGRGSFWFLPANSFIVVVPTIHAPMPKLAAVVSKRSAEPLGPGILPQRLPRILPSMVVHMWQMTWGRMRCSVTDGLMINRGDHTPSF